MAEETKDDNKKVKLTVNLSGPIYDTLQELADQQGVTVTEALRKAIGTEKFLREQTSSGGKILIQDQDKSLKQVLLR
jgi:hypothetical protein